MLFQLCGTYGLSETLHRRFGFNRGAWSIKRHHTLDYFDGLLKPWLTHEMDLQRAAVVTEHYLQHITLPEGVDVLLQAYLQDYALFWDIREEVYGKLAFDESVAAKYPRLAESAFVHVRGGDYVGHSLHHVDLQYYYPRALEHVGAPHYYVFTNDRSYCERMPWLADIEHTFVDENEVDSLYLMTQCARGGVCANSTFSWWGAALAPNRTLCLPDKWFNDTRFRTEGYFFPGSSKIPTARDA